MNPHFLAPHVRYMRHAARALTVMAGLLAATATVGFAAGPVLSYPTSSDNVFVSIPYFDWVDFVGHPYVGSYEIQLDNDSGFAAPLDEDTVPALISHYSPDTELAAGSYYWRVRYVDEADVAGDWSTTESFTITAPATVVDVLTTDGWTEIRAKLDEVVAAASSTTAAELRFPVDHEFHLTQVYDPGDSTSVALFYLVGAGPGEPTENIIINGRGSKIVLRATAPTLQCGFYLARNSAHLQVKDIKLDYEKDSLMQYGGVITALNKTTRTFTVTVDTSVYQNFVELADSNEVYFVDGANQQRIGAQGVAYSMDKTWHHARTGPNTFEFVAASNTWGRYNDELAVGDYCVSSDRGGDAIILFNTVNDFVANDVTVEGCRGRYFIARLNVQWARCINNQFLRTGGRIMGAPSGGINDHGESTWMEGLTLEYTRDDSLHTGESVGFETVVRGNTITGAFRNSIWVHSDRSWVVDNTINLAGTGGIQIGGAGLETDVLNLMNVGLITGNVINAPRRYGLATQSSTSVTPDVETGYDNQFVTITGNTINDFQSYSGMILEHLIDSEVSDNLVANPNATGWRVDDIAGDDGSEYHYGFQVADSSRDLTGSGNSVTDTRVDSGEQLVVADEAATIGLIVNGSGAGDTTPPAAPVGFSALGDDGAVELDWADNTEIDFDHYGVWRSNSSGGAPVELSGSLTSSEITDSPLANRNTYYYLAAAYDTDGRRSDYSMLASPFASPDTLYEDWKTASVGSLTGATSVSGHNTWTINANNFAVEVLDDAVLGSRAIGRTTNDVLSGGSSTAVDTHTLGLTTLDPIAEPVGLRVKFRYNQLATAGRAEGRFGVTESGGSQSYKLVANAKSDAAPITLSVNSATFDIGTAGDQNTDEIWEIETLFDRISNSSTDVDYTVTKNGELYVTGTYNFSAGLSGGTTFDTVMLEFRQNAQVSFDDLQVAWGAPTDTTAPATPGSLAATGSHTSIALDWSDNSETDFAGYNIYRWDTSSFELIAETVTTSAYTDTGRSSNTSYQYQVTAVDVTGNESSPTSTVTESTWLAKLAAPANVQATGEDGQIALDWDDSPEAHFSYYEINRATSADSSYSLLATSLTSSTYADTSVTNGEDYYYLVKAVDTAGKSSAWSGRVSAVPDTVVLAEPWERIGLSPEVIAVPTTIDAMQSWTINANNFVVELADTDGLESRAFGRTSYDLVDGGSATALDVHTAALDETLDPTTQSVKISFRAVFANTTTSGRDEFRVGANDDTLSHGYQIVLRSNTTQAPFELSVNGTSLSVGTAGDQLNDSVWTLEATFTRLSGSSTQLDYVIAEDGVTYSSGSTTIGAALSSSLTLTQAGIEVRQRSTVMVDDIEISY